MHEYIDPAWRDALQRQNKHQFQALWDFGADWVEEPNARRGGWSGVVKQVLEGPAGQPVPVYIKRQSNHVYRDWRHPLRGLPTFEREIRNILTLRDLNVPVLSPVYFGMRRHQGKQEALLVTEELTGFEPLEDIQQRWAAQPGAFQTEKRAVIDALAPAIRRLNDAGIQHGCLYPKHVFVRFDPSSRKAEVRLIDLEKARHRRHAGACRRRDLGTLSRHSTGISHSDRMRFLHAYQHTDHLDPELRGLWRHLAQREREKQARKGGAP